MLNKKAQKKKQDGFGAPEFLVVLFVVAIIAVLALPKIISSRDASQPVEVKNEIVSMLLDAQKEAAAQNAVVTFRYDGINHKIIVYGGKYGALNHNGNQVFDLQGDAAASGKILYGRLATVPAKRLGNISDITPINKGIVEVQFQPDGRALNEEKQPVNKCLFFYNAKNPGETAFAVTIAGNEGQIRIWRYNQKLNDYIE
jgi:prepilin-type N-terminal cleavage/methylation domain-containing protein